MDTTQFSYTKNLIQNDFVDDRSYTSINQTMFNNVTDPEQDLGCLTLHDSLLLPPMISSTSMQSNPTPLSASALTSEKREELADKNGELSDESSCASDESSEDAESKKIREIESELPRAVTPQPRSVPDDTTLQVADSSTPCHTKKYFCFYCHKRQSKLARHLEYMHSSEKDVKKFLDLPKGSRKRQELIATIRKNGNHLFNSDERFNDGTLIVCRRPNAKLKRSAQDFVSCPKCKGQYSRNVIRHHWRKCAKPAGKAERIVMIKSKALMGRLHSKANETVRTHIFPYMRDDEVVRSIRYDETIILYANEQCEKYKTNTHQYEMIKGRLRLLGRFYLALKNVNDAITDFASIFKPRRYDTCINAVKSVAGYKKESRTFKHPAVASNLGTLLKHVGELVRSEYIKSGHGRNQKEVEDFLKLLIEDYGITINKAVFETQAQNNRQKKVDLPSEDDILSLYNHLKAERTKYLTIMQKKGFSAEAWLKLAEATLISLQLFNRRKAGEIERIYVEDFVSYQGLDSSANKEVYNSLSAGGQNLANKYVSFAIRGKRGPIVPVLVPSDLLECMNNISKYRHDALVPNENPYFFGIQSSDPDRHKYLRACVLLRKFSTECGAKVPTSLRGTKLRKHIAKKCINLNLLETQQVSNLESVMGHHHMVPRDVDRLPVIESDIKTILKYLEAAQGGHDAPQESDNDEDESPMETVLMESWAVLMENGNGCPESKSTTYSGACANSNATSTLDGGTAKRERVSENGGPLTRRSWTNLEKETVTRAFGGYLYGKKLPPLSQLEDLIRKNQCLQGRTGPQIKTWIHNERKKKKPMDQL